VSFLRIITPPIVYSITFRSLDFSNGIFPTDNYGWDGGAYNVVDGGINVVHLSVNVIHTPI
jgi:hypothetical protein